ncbi:MAG TPA: hypothetical protein VN451_02915 [Chitinophagaceae bacterium]|nr:hypothetical protein [Chitinophagaceae bacterium]
MSRPEKFTERRLIIASRQTEKIEELYMSITNGGCGREWISEDSKPAYERAYCDLTVKLKDSTYHFGDSFSPLYINNLKLVVDKMNPWGKEEDSIPPGGCRIIVTRMEDISR